MWESVRNNTSKISGRLAAFFGVLVGITVGCFGCRLPIDHNLSTEYQCSLQLGFFSNGQVRKNFVKHMFSQSSH